MTATFLVSKADSDGVIVPGHLFEADSRDTIALCGYEGPIGPDNTDPVDDETIFDPERDLCEVCLQEAENELDGAYR